MKLIAKIIKRGPSLARVNIWLDREPADSLLVEVAVADEIVVALNVADAALDLLAACKAVLASPRGVGLTPEVVLMVFTAVAKAEPQPPEEP